MNKRKYLLLPILLCVFTLMVYVLDPEVDISWNPFKVFGIRVTSLDDAKFVHYRGILERNSTNQFRFAKFYPKRENTTKTSTILPISSSSQKRNIKNLSLENNTFSKRSETQAAIQLHNTLEVTKIATTKSSTEIQTENKNKSYSLCPNFTGRLGNHLFIFAAHFGIAMSKNMSVVLNAKSELDRIFKLNVTVQSNTDICRTAVGRSERWNCAYDENIMKFNNTENIRLHTYLQSWKYFNNFKADLRKQLVFRDDLQSIADDILKRILNEFKIMSRDNVTLVGIHIRRGDMVNNSHGYNVATPEYLSKAVQYFNGKYTNVLFIVSSQDLKWAKTNMPTNITAKYISHDRSEVIVATLSSCDHTITTVGSFSWWIGWLTGGEVTYFKWPAKEGSALRKHYSKDFSDFFYPEWVGY